MRINAKLIFTIAVVMLLVACSKPPEAPAGSGPGAASRPYKASEQFTFGVFGDNRTDGVPNPGFAAILEGMKADGVHLALNTGDLIYADDAGSPADISVLWSTYKASIAALPFPVQHAPGNHDFFNPASAKLYQAQIGSTFHAFDQANCRFIALDTTTATNRLSDEQISFLDKQLESAGDKLVFVYLHIPPFPSGPWLKGSLDGRDVLRLHKKLLAHKEKIGAVFCGHEHLFGFIERDGIPYYISGGANNTLYNLPPLGGFHHYLLVTVPSSPAPGEPRFTVQVRPVTPAGQLPATVRKIAPGDILEDFEQPHLQWAAWDNTIRLSSADAPDRPNEKALRLDYDTRFCRYPVLYSVFPEGRNLGAYDSLDLDVFVPPDAPPKVTFTAGIEPVEGKAWDAPAITLKPGWNPIHIDLTAKGIAPSARLAVKQLNFMLTPSTIMHPSYALFSNLRFNARSKDAAPLAESFDAVQFWNVWSDAASIGTSAEHVTRGKSALAFTYIPTDGAAVLYTTFDPALDFSQIHGLAIDLAAPSDLGAGSQLTLTLVHQHLAYTSPPIALKAGANPIAIPLAEEWLPVAARAKIHSLRLTVTAPGQKTKTIFTVDQLRAQ